MIHQKCGVHVFGWLFIGLVAGKALFYLVEANGNGFQWIEHHHLLAITSIDLIFGFCGFVIWRVNEKKRFQ
ncbi:hypothetical protein ACQ0QQ_00260 [Lysinibacillus sphaericus]